MLLYVARKLYGAFLIALGVVVILGDALREKFLRFRRDRKRAQK